jgi:hypothetical protein
MSEDCPFDCGCISFTPLYPEAFEAFMEQQDYEPTHCGCCGKELQERDPDPWEGRLDDYCYECALCRCDAYPGGCTPLEVQVMPVDKGIELILALEEAIEEQQAHDRGEEPKNNPMKGFGW